MVIKILWGLVVVHIIITWVMAVWRGWRARQQDRQQPPVQAKDLPPVSVIVPAWNEKGTIELCIESLKKMAYPTWEAIILAGGQDGTYKAILDATIDDSRFSVFEREPEPKNVAINRGFDKARYDILVILDADSIVDPEWLRALVEPLVSGESASYGFYLPIKKTWISIHEYIVQIQYHLHKTNVFPGCASVAIKRELLSKIGKLTNEAYSWEDWDVYARIINAGERIIPVTRAKLLSDRPATFTEFWDVNMRAFRTHLAGVWYHREKVFKQPLWAIDELLFLGFGSALSLAFIGGVLAVLAKPTLLPMISNIAALLAVWIFGRRAAIVAEVAAYTGESKWLAWAWAPIAILILQIPAALISIITIRRQPSFDYKGRREVPGA